MKNLTRKQKAFIIRSYEQSSNTILYDCYKTFSFEKQKAFNYCVDLCHSKNGFELRIISHNSMVFSVGFKYVDEKTGVLMFAYITRDYDRYFEYIQ